MGLPVVQSRYVAHALLRAAARLDSELLMSPRIPIDRESAWAEVGSYKSAGSTNSTAHPAKVGSRVSVFGTGARMNAAIQVRVDRQPAMVEYAGPAPLFPGVIQVDFLVPPTKSGT